MKYWKAILAVVVIFGTGLMTGVIATHLYGVREEADSERRMPPKRGPAGFGMRGDILKKMQRDLALSAEQSQEIEAILKLSQQRMKDLWDTISPQAKAEMDRTRDAIRAKLTPEQLSRFDEQGRTHDDWHKKSPKEGGRGGLPDSPAKPGEGGSGADGQKPSADTGSRKCAGRVGNPWNAVGVTGI